MERKQAMMELILVSLLSLFGSLVLFWLLPSEASGGYGGFDLGGAIVGFIIISSGSLTFLQKRDPKKDSLSIPQTQKLLSICNNNQASQYLLWVIDVLHNNQGKIDSKLVEAQFHEVLHGIRSDTLPDLQGFMTPAGKLDEIISSTYPESEKELMKDFKHCMALAAQQGVSPEEVRLQLQQYIESRRKVRMTYYMNKLTERSNRTK
jgi:hypothetical protein